MPVISLQRTYDFPLIKSIITHRRLWPHIASDFHPTWEDFEPNESEAIHYLLASIGDEHLGLFMTHWIISPLTWEVHHAILPSAWMYTDEIAAQAEHWIFTETPCETIVGHTPTCNKLACRFALKRGMVESGRIPNGYKKDGNLYDILIFNKQRPLCYNRA